MLELSPRTLDLEVSTLPEITEADQDTMLHNHIAQLINMIQLLLIAFLENESVLVRVVQWLYL